MNIHWLINPHGGFLNDYPGIHPPNSYSSSPTFHHLSIWLVVSTPLKNMSPSVGVTIPNIWKVIIQPCSKPPASFPSFIHGSSPSFPTFSHWNPTFSNRWGNPTGCAPSANSKVQLAQRRTPRRDWHVSPWEVQDLKAKQKGKYGNMIWFNGN